MKNLTFQTKCLQSVTGLCLVLLMVMGLGGPWRLFGGQWEGFASLPVRAEEKAQEGAEEGAQGGNVEKAQGGAEEGAQEGAEEKAQGGAEEKAEPVSPAPLGDPASPANPANPGTPANPATPATPANPVNPPAPTKTVTKTILAYDLHNRRPVFDRLFKVEMDKAWDAASPAANAFFTHSDLPESYLYAGFATADAQFLTLPSAVLEQVAASLYAKLLADPYKADIVVLVVPKTIPIEVRHIFPEGDRSPLFEEVNVPYQVWASLENSSEFMNLPQIFQSRIQRINEQGYVFREIRYFDGFRPITGLLESYDWFNNPLGGDRRETCHAEILYDRALASKEAETKPSPSEKKVDAASASNLLPAQSPKAALSADPAKSSQLAQVPQGSSKTPVTAASQTPGLAQANALLPVTGESSSLWLFLSSATLLAFGIFFFKKN